MRIQGQTLSTHVTNDSEKWDKPSGVKVDKKKKADSCHIPSDKEVRYTQGEVNLQKPGVFLLFFFFYRFVQKMELCGSNRKANSLISKSYTR